MGGSSNDEDRLNAIGDLHLDRLAHELRTPLAAIQSMAEALCGGHLGPVNNEQHAGYLRSIAETARHALSVVEGMLSPTRAMPSPPNSRQEIDLAALAGEIAMGMSLLAARSGVRVRSDAGETARICAYARPTDVRQMLINLVSNGIAHAGGGTIVRVEVGVSGDNLAWVGVVDDGVGIPQEVVDRFAAGVSFDATSSPPQDTRPRLGLTLTRALAEANGGRLEIRRADVGTEARITLPVLPVASAPEQTPTTSA